MPDDRNTKLDEPYEKWAQHKESTWSTSSTGYGLPQPVRLLGRSWIDRYRGVLRYVNPGPEKVNGK